MRLVPWCTVSRAAVRDRRELLERDLEPVRPREGAGCDERVAAADVPPLDAGQADGHPLARGRARHRRVVHLYGADPHVTSGRLQSQPVVLGDLPRPERAGRDGPDPAQREDPVDVEPGREVRPARRHRCRGLLERGSQLVEARAGHAAHRDDRRAGNELLRLLDRQPERLGVHRVGLRHGDDPTVDPEKPQHR